MNPKRVIKLCILAMVRALGGFYFARRLTRRHLRILCYHGGAIGDERLFNNKLFVTNSHVSARLDWLARKKFTPVSLDDAVNGLRRGHIGKDWPVVITVDDGWYSSRSHIIEPSLRQGFPITLYVASRVAELGLPVIDVVVNYIIWRASGRCVEISGFSPLPDGVYDLMDTSSHSRIASAVIDWLRGLPQYSNELSEGLRQFAAMLGVDSDMLNLQSRRFSYLMPAELREIASMGCAIELHGHAHWYPENAPDLLRKDIEACRDFLLSCGLPRPAHYCFPSGSFDHHAVAVFDELGVRSGTTCLPGLVDPYRPNSLCFLPRFLDGGGISKLEFEAEMSGFLEFVRSFVKRPAKNFVR